MTTRPQPDSEDSVGEFRWSNRILILAIVGILFLTLYPFRFAFNRHVLATASSFLLEGSGKSGRLDDFLNVLLFLPFGFGLAGKIREQGKSRMAALALTFAAGALFSYSIEFLQYFIPERDSGWEDVVTNSTGAVVGCLTFQYCGLAVLRLLNGWERAVGAFATVRKTAIVLLLYFGAWFAVSARLQQETALSDWSSDALLVVGNAASGQGASSWKGKVHELEFWDRAIPDDAARKLTLAGVPGPLDATALAAYDFSGSPPFQDERHFLPALSWTGKAPESIDSNAAVFERDSWLTSGNAVSSLVEDFRTTGQFAVRIVCEPTDVQGTEARILSISKVSGPANLELRQQDSDLVFWFRTPLTIQRARMSWVISDVFDAKQARDILFSYDGSNLSLFMNGKKRRRTYELGPGAALARLVRRIKPAELEGYEYIFYALVFAPAGCLLGFTWRKMRAQRLGRVALVALGFILPSVLFEIMLFRVGGRAISLGSIGFGILVVCAGSLWINVGLALKAPVKSASEAPAK
ncbi:MAG TPA: VanZ family protein [Terriglobales bacterium]|jgi:VanZ family protein|nr:VanZ family protein [Terriglobales bacterium]